MKTEYLEEFLLLAEIGNYGTAAEELFISESTLSRHIMSLEKELGTQLFIREPRKLTLSKSGTLLLNYAQRVVTAMSEYTDQLAEMEGTQLKLSIGYVRSVLQYGFMDTLQLFRKTNTDIDLILLDNNSEPLWQMVKNGECKFAFCYEYPYFEDGDLEKIRLLRDTMAVALPASHPLAAEESLTMGQLRKEHFILQPRNGAMYKTCMQLFRKAGYKPNISAYANGMQMLSLVSQGGGIALVEKKRFTPKCLPDVLLVELKPVVEKHLTLIYKKGPLGIVEKRFLDFISENLKQELYE